MSAQIAIYDLQLARSHHLTWARLAISYRETAPWRRWSMIYVHSLLSWRWITRLHKRILTGPTRIGSHTRVLSLHKQNCTYIGGAWLPLNTEYKLKKLTVHQCLPGTGWVIIEERRIQTGGMQRVKLVANQTWGVKLKMETKWTCQFPEILATVHSCT